MLQRKRKKGQFHVNVKIQNNKDNIAEKLVSGKQFLWILAYNQFHYRPSIQFTIDLIKCPKNANHKHNQQGNNR